MRKRANGHIWMAAQEFYNAGELIWNAEYVNFDAYLGPLLVNYAFSCELSLKASEGKVKGSEVSPEGILSPVNIESVVRGHDLKLIFEKLEQETQRVIKLEFVSSTNQQLIPLLRECANYFENCRYSFEKKASGYNLTSVRTLAKGLLDAVRAFGISQGNQ